MEKYAGNIRNLVASIVAGFLLVGLLVLYEPGGPTSSDTVAVAQPSPLTIQGEIWYENFSGSDIRANNFKVELWLGLDTDPQLASYSYTAANGTFQVSTTTMPTPEQGGVSLKLLSLGAQQDGNIVQVIDRNTGGGQPSKIPSVLYPHTTPDIWDIGIWTIGLQQESGALWAKDALQKSYDASQNPA